MLYRVDLDGTITPLADYSSLGVINFHHQIHPGRTGMILDADTDAYAESLNIEVDPLGTVIKTWNMADIISATMVAGGDDPSAFVFPTPADWFHNNSVAYRLSDNSLIISSREDFVITLNYDSDAVEWILGTRPRNGSSSRPCSSSRSPLALTPFRPLDNTQFRSRATTSSCSWITDETVCFKDRLGMKIERTAALVSIS